MRIINFKQSDLDEVDFILLENSIVTIEHCVALTLIIDTQLEELHIKNLNIITGESIIVNNVKKLYIENCNCGLIQSNNAMEVTIKNCCELRKVIFPNSLSKDFIYDIDFQGLKLSNKR